MEAYLFNVLLGSTGPIITLGVILLLATIISNAAYRKYPKRIPKKITIFKWWGILSLIILVFQGIKPQLTYKNTGYDVKAEASHLKQLQSSKSTLEIPQELKDRSRPIRSVTDEELDKILKYKDENYMTDEDILKESK